MVLRGKLRGRVGSRRDYLQSPREHLALAGFFIFYSKIKSDFSTKNADVLEHLATEFDKWNQQMLPRLNA